MFDFESNNKDALYSAVLKAADSKTAREVVYGNNQVNETDADSNWVNSSMKRLTDKFDKDTVKKIRMDCQCGHGMEERISLVRELAAHSSNLEEFGSLDKAEAAGLFFENRDLYLKFPVCTCPMLQNIEKLDDYSWCHCTAGYSKVLFEKAFDCNVDVILLKSVKMGDEICLMKIIPQKTSWQG